MAGKISHIAAVTNKVATPDPALLGAIGLNHSLESAVADLVDNAIDAEADRVLIRFVMSGGIVDQLLVVDNGRGMNSVQIDDAMVLGIRRERDESELGHFGMGLKAASFSQADQLTVLSRSASEASGRRMSRSSEDFNVEELAAASVDEALDGTWTDFATPTGTVVAWDGCRRFPKVAETTHHFLEDAVHGLKAHLGLVFHRLLVSDRLLLEVDVFDENDGPGFPFQIEPLDPFDYRRSGAEGYPKTLVATVGKSKIAARCHIWPGRSDLPQYRLKGMSVEQTQGLYLYRNDRLLSYAGWKGTATPSKKLQTTPRVAIDIDGHLGSFIMSMEKSAVGLSAEVQKAITVAKATDGTTFSDYLATAEDCLARSNKRRRTRTAVLPPGKGVSPFIVRAVHRELPIIEGEDPIDIRWTRMNGDEFVRVDREERTLCLNDRFRSPVLRGHNGSLNDAPLLKALLFLLYEDIFRGAAFGPRDKDNVAIWRAVLNAAALEEEKMYGD